MEIATLGGGCFWCTEGIFKEIKGVTDVTSGYAGGSMPNPNYEDVSSGETNHAEVIQIKFNPQVINYKDILYIFFKTHDPTTMNRQGNDSGTQYRSVIFYHTDEQKNVAAELKKELQKDYDNPIITQIVPLDKFYSAEGYHQDYFEKNPDKPYCMLIIDPKIQKLRRDFKEFLK
jgi:peptide-methionine (S)-S-oxide reductase